jgi:hypothetical protein
MFFVFCRNVLEHRSRVSCKKAYEAKEQLIIAYNYTHIHYLCLLNSFDEWQRNRLTTERKQPARPLVDFFNKLVT